MKSIHKCFVLLAVGSVFFARADAAVTVTEQNVVIPTYISGPPDPNPMFYFGRQSQGAEGRIYPYPIYDNLTNIKGEQTYHLIYLENEYVKIGILPEIGGRVFSGLDKTNNYSFIYSQHVIKPALIGLIGAWISGGIEWNIPHHHRASTFLPVQYSIEEHADGSKTVWVGELEIRQRMRWAVGYTLRPGRAVLECSVRIVNRTPLTNTMLCFANVAVHANENYQIIFPPSTQWVTYHAKRDFASWPIANGRFNNADFTGGVDVSWYKNHFSSNSMFAWNYDDDFFAGYDHGKDAGTMSVADHHLVPGKKFWTWGNGPSGRMWDGILTDDDGPYVELMVGAYSDNQPDYSWLAPYETRAFQMNWYPFRGIGGAKNANLDAAVNLEVKDNVATVGFYATSARPQATARLVAGDKVLLDEKISIDPGKPYSKQVSLQAGLDEHSLRASLVADGKELVAYSPVKLEPTPMPAIYTPPPSPANIATDEELYLTGLRVDQFHSPSLDPEPFWEEALRRDPGDAEVNDGMGRLDLRRGKFAEAEQHFRTAIARLTANYTDAKDGEPLYDLGFALKVQGKNKEATDALYKATWNQEWKGPAYFALAQMSAAEGNFDAALDLVDHSLDANGSNLRALNLKAAILRHLGRSQEALTVLATAAAKADPLDAVSLSERWLATKDAVAAKNLFATLNQFPFDAQEVASEYAAAGLTADAAAILAATVAAAPDKSKINPMVYYYLGDFAEKAGDKAKAVEYRRLAQTMPPDYVFPFQQDAIAMLRRAVDADPKDARAPYYLGNLLFDWQPEEAVKMWQLAAARGSTFPIVYRNLAQAYLHDVGGGKMADAIANLEYAIARDPVYADHFYELDQLYEAAGVPAEKRLALLEANEKTVLQRDDARSRLINLKIFAGKADDAIALMTNRTFSIWEGGNRFNTGDSWTDAHIVRGQQRLAAKNYAGAIEDFNAALAQPENLRVSQRENTARLAEISYWLGETYAAMGDTAKAREAWQQAASASATGAGGRRGGRGGAGSSQRGAQPYYQALALQKLGQTAEAQAAFQQLLASGQGSLGQDSGNPDPSLSSTEQLAQRTRVAAAHYLQGLGYAGMGDNAKAREQFNAALAASPDYLGAKLALSQLPSGT